MHAKYFSSLTVSLALLNLFEWLMMATCTIKICIDKILVFEEVTTWGSLKR